MTDPLPYSAEMESFLEAVRGYAGIDSKTESERVARSTVSTLAMRITAGQVNDLRSALPSELQAELGQRTGQAESFGKDGFLERVSGGIDTVDMDTVESQTRAVLRVVAERTPEEQIDDTIAQLPDDLARMFRP